MDQSLLPIGRVTPQDVKAHYALTELKLRLKDKATDGDVLFEYRDRTFSLEAVIADMLHSLRNYAFAQIPELASGAFGRDLVRWCLTVPEIWTDEANALMRRAAARAEMIAPELVDEDSDGRLILVSEPQSAALYVMMSDKVASVALAPGVRFMIFDAGGGTIDTSCYVVAQDKTLHQIGKYNGDGDEYGSTRIDNRFIRLFCDAIGLEGSDELDRGCPSGYRKLRDEWEKVKLSFDPDAADERIWRVPLSEDLTEYLADKCPEAVERLQRQGHRILISTSE